MFVKRTMKIRNRKTNEVLDCFTQAVQLNPYKNEYVLCYNIGINGYNNWTFICAEYDNDTFNKNWEVINEFVED